MNLSLIVRKAAACLLSERRAARFLEPPQPTGLVLPFFS